LTQTKGSKRKKRKEGRMEGRTERMTERRRRAGRNIESNKLAYRTGPMPHVHLALFSLGSRKT